VTSLVSEHPRGLGRIGGKAMQITHTLMLDQSMWNHIQPHFESASRKRIGGGIGHMSVMNFARGIGVTMGAVVGKVLEQAAATINAVVDPLSNVTSLEKRA